MRALRAHVTQIDRAVAGQFTLNPKVPVVTGAVLEVRIEQHWSEMRPIRNDRRRCGLRNIRQRERSVDIAAIKGAGCVQWICDIVLFERGIATSVAEEVTEHSVMKNPERAANRRLPIFPRIPGKSHPRFYVRVVLLVNRLARSRSH